MGNAWGYIHIFSGHVTTSNNVTGKGRSTQYVLCRWCVVEESRARAAVCFAFYHCLSVWVAFQVLISILDVMAKACLWETIAQNKSHSPQYWPHTHIYLKFRRDVSWLLPERNTDITHKRGESPPPRFSLSSYFLGKNDVQVMPISSISRNASLWGIS